MKRLLILGAGTEQVTAITQAKEKGISSLVLDMNPNAPGASAADEFYPVSTRDVSAIESFLKTYTNPIDGVMTIASDIPHVVSAVAQILNLPHIPLEVAQVCVDKFRMKDVLLAGNVSVPAFANVASVDDLKAFIEKVGYPAVIKPVDNSGARGVLRLTEDTDLEWAFEYSKKFSYSGNLIAEKFVDGLQISTEGIMLDDVFYCTGFADRNYERLETTAPFMVEDGGDIPSILPEPSAKIVQQEFEKAVRALGITWGPAKGDMVFGTDGKAYVIEIAARLSGGNFCYDKVPWSTGIDIVDILIDMSVGNPVDTARFVPTKNLATSQRYFFPAEGVIERIDGVDEVSSRKDIRKVDVWAKVGDTVPPFENHPSRVGYVISLAPTLAEAVAAAENAVKGITFVVTQK
jgi:biotin carboxylase